MINLKSTETNLLVGYLFSFLLEIFSKIFCIYEDLKFGLGNMSDASILLRINDKLFEE